MLDVRFAFNGDFSPDAIMRMAGLEEGGAVQTAVDNAIVRYMHDYWAFDTGTLAEAVRGQGTGELTYYQPYAHYQYYGVLYTDELGRTFVGAGETKPVNTGIPLNYKKDRNPQAGAYPLERMKADHLQDIIEEAHNVARGQ